MMKARYSFQGPFATVLGVNLALFSTFARPVAVQSESLLPQQTQSQSASTVVEIDADAHVDRARLILGHHLPHLFALQPKHKVGLPDVNALSQEQRYRFAIREFSAALKNKNELVGYSVSQVHGYLADTYCSLAALLRGQARKTPRQSASLRQRSRQFFDLSFRQYKLALENDPKDLKYTLAERLVGAMITAHDYNKALNLIQQLDRANIKLEPYEDHGLLRLKAEAYLALGKDEEAGLAYEDWIRRGNVDSYLMPGKGLYEKLRDLQHKTGHPNNLPS